MVKSVNMQQLMALAAKGNPEARMLLSMRRSAVQNQDDQDRRWRNMSYAVDQLKAQGKEPQTCQEFLNVLARYGFVPVNRLTAAQKARQMRFDQFMSVCGGFSNTEKYAAKGEPDAPTKCEGCRQLGAGLRCSWCGEWYCSTTCFVKDLKAHMPTCSMAADNMHMGTPPSPRPELMPADKYAKLYGLPPPPPAAHSSSSSGSRAAAAGTTAPGSAASGSSSNTGQQQQQQQHKEGVQAALESMFASLLGSSMPGASEQQEQLENRGKNHNRNVKRKQKLKQQKAAAAAAAAAAGDAADMPPLVEVKEEGPQEQQQQQHDGV